MFLEALVCGKITFPLSPHPPLFPFLSAPHTDLLFPTAGIPTVAPPSVRPAPRPDVTPPSVGTFLIYAQGQQIGSLPLNGTRLQKDTANTLLSLHVKWLSPVGAELHGVRSGEGPDMEEVLKDFWAAVCLHGPDTSTTKSAAVSLRLRLTKAAASFVHGVSDMWQAYGAFQGCQDAELIW